MNNELIIDSTPSEVVIALISDKRLVELNREKSNNQNNQQKFNNNKQNGDSSPFKEVIKWIFGI